MMIKVHGKRARSSLIATILGGRLCLAFSLALTLACGVSARAGQTLTNASGGGTVTVTVDSYGAFGSSVGPNSSDAIYDPVGVIPSAGTAFESGVAIRFGSAGTRQFLTSGDIGGSGGLAEQAIVGTALTAASTFSIGGLSFALNQALTSLFDMGSQIGSQLQQTYVITNTTGAAINFELVRYIDGDLQFDGSIDDGGGRFVSGGTEFLFETDNATGSNVSTTLLAISAVGGTIPGLNRFEVDSFSGLRSRIIAGTALDNSVVGDGADADQFIDAGNGYDVTLALRNVFNLAAGQSATYVTSTRFGSGSPEQVVNSVPEPSMLLLGTMAIIPLAIHAKRRRATA
jgi:hypothetical protein